MWEAHLRGRHHQVHRHQVCGRTARVCKRDAVVQESPGKYQLQPAYPWRGGPVLCLRRTPTAGSLTACAAGGQARRRLGVPPRQRPHCVAPQLPPTHRRPGGQRRAFHLGDGGAEREVHRPDVCAVVQAEPDPDDALRALRSLASQGAHSRAQRNDAARGVGWLMRELPPGVTETCVRARCSEARPGSQQPLGRRGVTARKADRLDEHHCRPRQQTRRGGTQCYGM